MEHRSVRRKRECWWDMVGITSFSLNVPSPITLWKGYLILILRLLQQFRGRHYTQDYTRTRCTSDDIPKYSISCWNPSLCKSRAVESYLVSYAHRYDLLPYIRFNHKVLNASWLGTPEAGLWNVTFSDHRNETHYDTFEHLIVATGNNHFPREPSWPGQDEWLAKTAGGNGTQREIIHSAWYRHPEKYTNKSILIVGDSPSGRAVATETASLVSKARTFSSLC
jgi:cation diffusion facilitator CzcD-associated flavoprotein CzcO